MIHATESEIAPGAHRGTRTLRHARGTHVNADSSGIYAPDWPVMGFGHQPEPNSLWDTGLLDRLSLPLTRFHE